MVIHRKEATVYWRPFSQGSGVRVVSRGLFARSGSGERQSSYGPYGAGGGRSEPGVGGGEWGRSGASTQARGASQEETEARLDITLGMCTPLYSL